MSRSRSSSPMDRRVSSSESEDSETENRPRRSGPRAFHPPGSMWANVPIKTEPESEVECLGQVSPRLSQKRQRAALEEIAAKKAEEIAQQQTKAIEARFDALQRQLSFMQATGSQPQSRRRPGPSQEEEEEACDDPESRLLELVAERRNGIRYETVARDEAFSATGRPAGKKRKYGLGVPGCRVQPVRGYTDPRLPSVKNLMAGGQSPNPLCAEPLIMAVLSPSRRYDKKCLTFMTESLYQAFDALAEAQARKADEVDQFILSVEGRCSNIKSLLKGMREAANETGKQLSASDLKNTIRACDRALRACRKLVPVGLPLPLMTGRWCYDHFGCQAERYIKDCGRSVNRIITELDWLEDAAIGLVVREGVLSADMCSDQDSSVMESIADIIRCVGTVLFCIARYTQWGVPKPYILANTAYEAMTEGMMSVREECAPSAPAQKSVSKQQYGQPPTRVAPSKSAPAAAAGSAPIKNSVTSAPPVTNGTASAKKKRPSVGASPAANVSSAIRDRSPLRERSKSQTGGDTECTEIADVVLALWRAEGENAVPKVQRISKRKPTDPRRNPNAKAPSPPPSSSPVMPQKASSPTPKITLPPPEQLKDLLLAARKRLSTPPNPLTYPHDALEKEHPPPTDSELKVASEALPAAERLNGWLPVLQKDGRFVREAEYFDKSLDESMDWTAQLRPEEVKAIILVESVHPFSTTEAYESDALVATHALLLGLPVNRMPHNNFFEVPAKYPGLKKAGLLLLTTGDLGHVAAIEQCAELLFKQGKKLILTVAHSNPSCVGCHWPKWDTVRFVAHPTEAWSVYDMRRPPLVESFDALYDWPGLLNRSTLLAMEADLKSEYGKCPPLMHRKNVLVILRAGVEFPSPSDTIDPIEFVTNRPTEPRREAEPEAEDILAQAVKELTGLVNDIPAPDEASDLISALEGLDDYDMRENQILDLTDMLDL
ncbi:ICP4-like protein [Testudinid alphaherpesvirus 3]|uniref:ICP4-like protein n=1 Tax=Testudinid alphaherpesvirus 3 TaxID=2560801 RepID=A0A0K1R159_9ALPH|nr:ICP4-like protein [Testudinid alphaherpesvirus 3]AKV40669.1 ICP4-like protein [Testudinid alphaherpesvirus 3]